MAATVYERDNCIGAASQTSLTGFKLRLRRRLLRTGGQMKFLNFMTVRFFMVFHGPCGELFGGGQRIAI